TSTMLPSGFGGFPAPGTGNSAQILAVEPGHPDHVYLAVPGLANGPSYYHPSKNENGDDLGPDGGLCNTRPRGTGLLACGEGSLWLGDYSNFTIGKTASWGQLPGPPRYFWVSTGSGNLYILT